MTSTDTPAAPPAGKPRKPRYPATVSRVQKLTPRMVRVTFSSPELAEFGWNGPAAHIKLIFGDVSVGLAPPEGGPRPTMRTYTPRRFDRDSRELDVDFVLHGVGPASTWASQAAVGQRLTVAGPGRNYVVDPSATRFLLVGDESAIPAISTILEHLPASARATVLLEVIDAAEEHEIAHGPNVTVRWLHRGEDASKAGALLESAVRELDFGSEAYRVYVACEAAAMRKIRRHLLTERGMSRDHIVTRGYWKRGATDHPDGDYGQDV
jgi:NADPH-dependent ferric siderophore reductase